MFSQLIGQPPNRTIAVPAADGDLQTVGARVHESLTPMRFRAGVRPLRTYLKSLEAIVVKHVALNLRFNPTDIETILKRSADELLANFS